MQSRQALHVLGAAGEAAQPRGAARVLPREDRGQRAAVFRVPADEARALHGESRRRPARRLDDARELGERGVDARDQFLWIVFDVAERVSLRRDRDERGALERAVGGIGAGARRMSALVDGDVDVAGHAGTCVPRGQLRRQPHAAPSTRPSPRRGRRARAQGRPPSPRRRPRPRRRRAARARPAAAGGRRTRTRDSSARAPGRSCAGSPSSTQPIGTRPVVRARRTASASKEITAQRSSTGAIAASTRSMQCARP